MPQEKTQRVTLRIEEADDGQWVFKYCIDTWKTLPFVWPSQASAQHDMSLIIQTMMKRGYVVVDQNGEEVANKTA